MSEATVKYTIVIGIKRERAVAGGEYEWDGQANTKVELSKEMMEKDNRELSERHIIPMLCAIKDRIGII